MSDMSFVGDGYKHSRFEVMPEEVYEQLEQNAAIRLEKKLNVSLLIFSLCCDPLKFFTREKCQSMSNTPWRFKCDSNSSSDRTSSN